MKHDYESYFQLTREQQKLVQNLLLREYFNLDLPDKEIIKQMKADWAMYERAERYDTCALFKDALALLDDN